MFLEKTKGRDKVIIFSLVSIPHYVLTVMTIIVNLDTFWPIHASINKAEFSPYLMKTRISYLLHKSSNHYLHPNN